MLASYIFSFINMLPIYFFGLVSSNWNAGWFNGKGTCGSERVVDSTYMPALT